MNNLLVLSRESETSASRIWNDGKIIETLMKVIDDSSANEAVVVAAVRVLDELVKNSNRVFFFYLFIFLEILNSFISLIFDIKRFSIKSEMSNDLVQIYFLNDATSNVICSSLM